MLFCIRQTSPSSSEMRPSEHLQALQLATFIKLPGNISACDLLPTLLPTHWLRSAKISPASFSTPAALRLPSWINQPSFSLNSATSDGLVSGAPM